MTDGIGRGFRIEGVRGLYRAMKGQQRRKRSEAIVPKDIVRKIFPPPST